MVSENYQKLANSTAAFAAAAAAASGASSADAADLVRKTPAASPAPWQNAVSWEGWYVGGSLGASWLKSDPSSQDASFFNNGYGYAGAGFYRGESVGSATKTGWIASIQSGRNWQTGNVVYGFEGDLSLGNQKASSTGSISGLPPVGYATGRAGYGGTTARTSQIDAMLTLRGRIGYDFNGILPYFTAGLALADIRNTWSVAGYSGNALGNVGGASVTQTSWVPGLAIGGGLEYRIDRNWSVRGEVLWIKFQEQKLGNIGSLSNGGYGALGGSGGTINFHNDLTTAKVGFNYRF